MLALYRQLPFNNAAYRQLAGWLMEPFDGALLQHCAVGKDRTGVGCALTLFALGCDRHTVMEEYLLTQGMLTQVEDFMLQSLGNALTPRGRQNLAEMMTVHESMPGWRKSISSRHRREKRSSRGFWRGNPLPFSGCRARVDGLHSGSQEKNVISYTSHLPVCRKAHIMRSHRLPV